MALTVEFWGADVLWPDGLRRAPLALGGGKILRDDAGIGRKVDLTGYRVLPGMIDVHGDAFERHVAPRRGAMKDIGEGLRAAEAEIAANGVTTAVIAQFVSWEGGLRGPEFADDLFTALRSLRDVSLTDLRGQARLEWFMLDEFPDFPERLDRWGVEYVVFNDHLPHDRLAAGKPPPGLAGKALRARRSPEKHLALMQALYARRDEVPEAVDRLCARLADAGIRQGSHDDGSPEVRDKWRERGARISEFPETLDAAEAARAAGDLIVMGAPNLVRGGSHKGNISAVDLVTLGLCDALASDYHYPSLRRAALFLVQAGVCDLAGAWALVSSGPAKVLGLTDRGRIAPGLRADLVVLDEHDRIAATIVAGRISYLAGDVAERFLS